MSFTAAVLTVSDKASRGERADTAGPAVVNMLEAAGYEIVHTEIIPDGPESVSSALLDCADKRKAALILTVGGTGFSPRDLTPEATKAVLEREVPGIPEAMRAASMLITPRGCLSRAVAGIRGSSLIVNLPGSEKAAKENLAAVLEPIFHGLSMLASGGSADCAAEFSSAQNGNTAPVGAIGKSPADQQSAPSMDAWLAEAKAQPNSGRIGMYLFHNGVVRATPRAEVREGKQNAPAVIGMRVSYDPAKLAAALEETKRLPGIGYARAWLNKGTLRVGDPIMTVLVGGDVRPHVVDALQFLVGKLKTVCIKEEEF